jgi:rhamnulokinase
MGRYLGFDLGAESGRAILGTLDGARLTLQEIHRFSNDPVRLPTGLYWDTLRLFWEIQRGLQTAIKTVGKLDGAGVDTWGVDFAFLGRDGALVDNPRHYRDARTDGQMERTFAVVPRSDIFAATGIQFMQLNSLFQWHAMVQQHSPALETADCLLFMPDLFNYWLTGEKRAEVTIASTSQFYNPVARTWAFGVLERLRLRASLLPKLIEPGTLLGPERDTGVPVYATAGHDTAAAVAAVPAKGEGWCYISSGTWSLMGVETAKPVINDAALEANFTNEIGVGGTVRLLKNIAGLWLWQECRRAWAEQGREYSYEQMAEMAAEARPFSALLDPDAFLAPGNMPKRIAEWCVSHGQEPPATDGEYCRATLEALAFRYRQVLETLEQLTGKPITHIHIVGGGAKNRLLNKFAADATGRSVLAGPVEATAIGNVLVQALGAGELRGMAELRQVVADSFPVTVYPPETGRQWEVAYRRWRLLLSSAAPA